MSSILLFNLFLSPLTQVSSLNLSDLPQLLKTVGYFGIAAIIFAESGLLVGFFLPGDSLLFTAGVLSSAAAGKLLNSADGAPGGVFNLMVLIPLCFAAAVAGDSVGYWFGTRTGPRIFNKENSLFFNRKHIKRAQAFFDRQGGKTIIMARFLPVVRTFAPIVAGVGQMKYRTFLLFNLVGGFLWVVSVTLAGYFLGELIPPDQVDKFVIPVVGLIIVVSIAPTAWHILKEKENREQLKTAFRKLAGRKTTANVKEDQAD